VTVGGEHELPCSTVGCLEAPTVRVYWPGRDPPPRYCATCAFRARRVADAMGFALTIEPLPVERP
jgi:hypothetical protein